MCCVLSGESGRVLRHLLADEGIRVVAVERDARSGAYVHDRRGGERVSIVEIEGDPISRHDFDELYGVTLREGLDAGLVILSGRPVTTPCRRMSTVAWPRTCGPANRRSSSTSPANG